MQKHLYLDLEETLVDNLLSGWHASCWLEANVAKVKNLITMALRSVDSVTIFSFAIPSSRDAEAFLLTAESEIQEKLELDPLKPLRVVHMEEMLRVNIEEAGLTKGTVDKTEMIQLWGKQMVFCRYVHHLAKMFPGDVHILLDDVVYDELIHWPELNTRVVVANIDNLDASSHITRSFR